MAGRTMRMRRLTLLPGGAVPPRDHVDRPAIVYILQGRVREYRSDRDGPVEYGAGDSMTENAALHRWIGNIGAEPLVGIVVDIANEGGAPALTKDAILEAYGRQDHVHDGKP
jgi:quercetin dioxygenase-like cupin family protein